MKNKDHWGRVENLLNRSQKKNEIKSNEKEEEISRAKMFRFSPINGRCVGFHANSYIMIRGFVNW